MTGNNRKILLATDLSEDCRNAYNYAVDLAAAYHGQIILLHVIDAKPISTSLERRINSLLGDDCYGNIMQAYENDAKSILIGKRKEVDIIKSALSKFRTKLSKFSDDFAVPSENTVLPDDQILVRKGQVVEGILDAAEENQSDLIILGTHSRSPDGVFVSRTVHEVLMHSRVPVVIVPPVMM